MLPAKGSAFIDIIALPGHKIYNLMPALFIELSGIRILDSCHISGKFNNGNLHSQADSKIGELLFPGIFGSQDHSFDASASKSAGNQNSVQTRELFALYLQV